VNHEERLVSPVAEQVEPVHHRVAEMEPLGRDVGPLALGHQPGNIDPGDFIQQVLSHYSLPHTTDEQIKRLCLSFWAERRIAVLSPQRFFTLLRSVQNDMNSNGFLRQLLIRSL